MAIALLSPSLVSKALTPDQKWALNFGLDMHFAACISIVVTVVSMVGFGLTHDHGLPEAQKNGKVKKFAHNFFTCTLFLSASAIAVSFLGAAYAVRIYNKT